MKKIGFLSTCILMILLVCLMDGRFRKEKYRETFEVVKQKETETEEPRTEISETEKSRETSIRVLITSDSFASPYHSAIVVTSKEGFAVTGEVTEEKFLPGEPFSVAVDSPLWEENQVLRLEPESEALILPELVRGVESPSYQGSMEIRRTEEGLLVINELPLEQYLCGVVPSEMPASYPQEALKAQAVCARTYAVKQQQEGRAREFFADVDDSVSYQVYNNQQHSQASDQAVLDTEGMVLMEEGELIDALYYSTSCGMNTRLDLAQEAVFASFIRENQERAYEAEEPWYRWSTRISLAAYEGLVSMEVTERSPDGRAEKMEVTRSWEGEQQKEILEGEYAIREFLGKSSPVISLKDGTTSQGMSLLPSAYFMMTPEYEGEILKGYFLQGGGYGHGIGMSQNGAKHMAAEGMNFQEILKIYYGETACLAESS